MDPAETSLSFGSDWYVLIRAGSIGMHGEAYPEKELETVLQKIDAGLCARRVPIRVRPLAALNELSRELGLVDVPIVGGSNREHPNGWVFPAVVHWYETRYGESLKSEMSLGRTVIELRGDIWVMRVPVTYGQIQAVASRDRLATGSGRVAACDVVRCVSGIPEGVRSSLGENELKRILDVWVLAHSAFSGLSHLGGDPMIASALGDHNGAVMYLSGRPPHFGQSKWASLQATEKTLKAFVAAKGRSYSKKGHSLDRCAEEAEAAGLPHVDRRVISSIQGDAGMRYGETMVSCEEALIAHHNALSVAAEVANAW